MATHVTLSRSGLSVPLLVNHITDELRSDADAEALPSPGDADKNAIVIDLGDWTNVITLHGRVQGARQAVGLENNLIALFNSVTAVVTLSIGVPTAVTFAPKVGLMVGDITWDASEGGTPISGTWEYMMSFAVLTPG